MTKQENSGQHLSQGLLVAGSTWTLRVGVAGWRCTGWIGPVVVEASIGAGADVNVQDKIRRMALDFMS